MKHPLRLVAVGAVVFLLLSSGISTALVKGYVERVRAGYEKELSRIEAKFDGRLATVTATASQVAKDAAVLLETVRGLLLQASGLVGGNLDQLAGIFERLPGALEAAVQASSADAQARVSTLLAELSTLVAQVRDVLAGGLDVSVGVEGSVAVPVDVHVLRPLVDDLAELVDRLVQLRAPLEP